MAPRVNDAPARHAAPALGCRQLSELDAPRRVRSGCSSASTSSDNRGVVRATSAATPSATQIARRAHRAERRSWRPGAGPRAREREAATRRPCKANMARCFVVAREMSLRRWSLRRCRSFPRGARVSRASGLRRSPRGRCESCRSRGRADPRATSSRRAEEIVGRWRVTTRLRPPR